MSPAARPAGHRRVLGPRDLNRALLARQLLLDRTAIPLERAVEQMGGIQDQYAPSAYTGLWTRVREVRRTDVTAALEAGALVQGTLHRVTIHVVSRAEYWRYAIGFRQARRAWFLRLQPAGERDAVERRLVALADGLRGALQDGPRPVRELERLVGGSVGNAGLWVDLVRVPPSGTWERRRADRIALAEQWVGPCDATEDEGLAHLVQAYLRAFGPAPWPDIAAWAGVPVRDLQRAGSGLDLVQHADADGRLLLDLRDAPLPDPGTPAPVRFLPHWDAVTLAHARRTGTLPEVHRPRIYHTRNPASVGTVLVDGRVAGSWRHADGRIVVELFDDLDRRGRDALEEERAALEAFQA